MQASETILLTGATGFVGRELLWRLARVPQNEIVCLIRSRDSSEACGRVQEILDKARPSEVTPEQRSRVRAISGDLTVERLGLASEQWDQLVSSATRVVHGAASVEWARPLNEARQINVAGTRSLIELAQAARARGRLRAFDYISTCYVCGKRTGLITESDLDGSQGFFNSYEQSKFEAEQLVRSSGLPFCIFRLSTVVGDSRTGYASTFKVMYWPLKILARGLAWVVPADRNGIVDLVPVDYVCDTLEAIAADPCQRGKTFHVAAGPDRSSTIGDILELAVKCFGQRPPILIPPIFFEAIIWPLYLIVGKKRRELLKKGKVYRPYFSYAAVFDTAEARAKLEPLGIRPPRVEDYFQRIIDYALATEWGKREV